MKRFLSYLLVAVLASGITSFIVGNQGQPYNKLVELEALIENYFVDEMDRDAVENAAAEAMVEALNDRWSYYMTAVEYKSYQEKMANAYVGIGVNITQREDGYITIVKVEENGPAEEAGIRPEDVLTMVEQQDISSMTVDEVKALVRGKEGTTVNLTLTRAGESYSVDVERRTIESVVAKATMLEENIGLVKIVNFDSRCAEETLAAVEDLLEQGAKALIFDVRFNPGGYKDELVKILDYLLPEGPLFRSVDYRGEESVDTSDEKCLEIPMAVLINGNSYSAAEFFAAALSEYGVAKLVGEPTTGKGHFQSTFSLSDGSAAVISIGKYRTPNGINLTDIGLTPDIPVEVDDETFARIYYGELSPEEDPQICAALDVLLGR